MGGTFDVCYTEAQCIRVSQARSEHARYYWARGTIKGVTYNMSSHLRLRVLRVAEERGEQFLDVKRSGIADVVGGQPSGEGSEASL